MNTFLVEKNVAHILGNFHRKIPPQLASGGLKRYGLGHI